MAKLKRPIVILTGAGISAESGIRTFRDHGGLWENHRIEDVASPEGFERNPELVHQFYNARRAQLLSPDVQPNTAHRALARLEREWPDPVLLVTQNVDDLHARAGSRSVIAMHGELLKARCLACHQTIDWREPIQLSTQCPLCSAAGGPDCLKNGALRPHIVWFGEMPLELDRIFEAVSRCAVFAAIGTSGQVYPAAGLVCQAPRTARKIELNAEASAVADSFDEQRTGPASRIVPEWVDELLADLR